MAAGSQSRHKDGIAQELIPFFRDGRLALLHTGVVQDHVIASITGKLFSLGHMLEALRFSQHGNNSDKSKPFDRADVLNALLFDERTLLVDGGDIAVIGMQVDA